MGTCTMAQVHDLGDRTFLWQHSKPKNAYLLTLQSPVLPCTKSSGTNVLSHPSRQFAEDKSCIVSGPVTVAAS